MFLEVKTSIWDFIIKLCCSIVFSNYLYNALIFEMTKELFLIKYISEFTFWTKQNLKQTMSPCVWRLIEPLDLRQWLTHILEGVYIASWLLNTWHGNSLILPAVQIEHLHTSVKSVCSYCFYFLIFFPGTYTLMEITISFMSCLMSITFLFPMYVDKVPESTKNPINV